MLYLIGKQNASPDPAEPETSAEESKMTTITINKIEQMDLHKHYDRQTSAQDCYIELDCESGVLSASYNSEIGNAIPFSVYHGHDQRFGIPALLGDAANALMSEIEPIAQRVVDGYTSEWDGNNNVARFTDDAKTAIEEIRALCDNTEADESNSIQECDAGDYLQNIVFRYGSDGKQCKYDWAVSVKLDTFGTITDKTTDTELDAIEAAIDADAESNVVINNLSKWLREERDNCKLNTENND